MLILIYFMILINASLCKLVLKPTDVVATIFSKVTFPCSSSKSVPVRWIKLTPGDSHAVDIFHGSGIITYPFKEKVIVESFNLTLLNITLEDSGLYMCIDDQGFGLELGDLAKAYLTIIHNFSCVDNFLETGFNVNDTINITCKLNYVGRFNDIDVKWLDGDFQPLNQSIVTEFNQDSLTITFILPMTQSFRYINQSFTCSINNWLLNWTSPVLIRDDNIDNCFSLKPVPTASVPTTIKLILNNETNEKIIYVFDKKLNIQFIIVCVIFILILIAFIFNCLVVIFLHKRIYMYHLIPTSVNLSIY